jgi:O-antigen ligase
MSPKRQRHLVLRWAEGLPIGARAAALGIGVGTVAGLWPAAFLPVTGFVLLAASLLTTPALGLGLLIATRSSLDLFSKRAVLPGLIDVNLASTLGGVILILLGLVIVVRLRAGTRIEWGGTVTLLWVGWLAFSLLEAGVGYLRHGGEALGLGLRGVIRLSTLLAVYLLVVNMVQTRRDRAILLGSLLIGFLIPAMVGYHQLLTGKVEHQAYDVGRLSGTFVHPNPYGLYLALIILVAIGLYADTRGRRIGRVLLAAVVGSGVVLLVFTFSRSAWALLLLCLVWWSWRRGRRARIAVVLCLIMIAGIFGGAMRWRFQDLIPQQTAVSGVVGQENSLLWRIRNYGLLLLVWRESPILGHGTGTTVLVNPQKTRTLEGFVRGSASHNELVRVLVEHGIVGIGIYLTFVVGLLLSLLRLGRRQPAPEGGGYPALAKAVRIYVTSLVILGCLGLEFMSHTAHWYAIMTLIGVVYSARTPLQSGPPHPGEALIDNPRPAAGGREETRG